MRGLSREQPDLCFDYDGIPGHDMTIISDSGHMFKFKLKNLIFLKDY